MPYKYKSRRLRKRTRRPRYNYGRRAKGQRNRRRARFISRHVGGFFGQQGARKIINIGPALLPPKMILDFKVCGNINLVTDAGAGVSEDNVVLSMNNPRVPITGVTNQPTGFDEWFGFFNKARVLSSSVKITFLFGALAQNVVYGIWPEAGPGDSTLPAALADSIPWTEWCEYPRVQHRVIPVISAVNSTTPVRVMRYKCKPHTFFNETLKGNDNFDFTSTVSPVNNVGLHVTVGNLDNDVALSNTSTLAVLKLEIYYKCMFYDRKNLVPSVV